MPRPKVGSAVIRLSLHSNKPVEVKDEGLLFQIIRSAFNQRRKTLVNGLYNGDSLDLSKEDILDGILLLGKSSSVRGETLTLEEFARLSNIIHEKIQKGKY